MQSACMANSSSLLPPAVLPPLSATTETWVESATADIQRQAVSFACPSGLLRVPTTGSNLLRDDVQLAELFAASKWPPGLQATSETSFQVQPDLANLILVANDSTLELVSFSLKDVSRDGDVGREILSSVVDSALVGVDLILQLYQAGRFRDIVTMHIESRRFFETPSDEALCLDPLLVGALKRIPYNTVWNDQKSAGHRSFDIELLFPPRALFPGAPSPSGGGRNIS